MSIRVGLGYDVHAYHSTAATDPTSSLPGAEPEPPALVLAGVRIDGHPGLVGHSDADAVAHAVADALLGPAGLPDLGSLFPASDERYRGASSMALLADVVGRVRREGWTVGNVDVVVNAEAPALAPHIPAMVANLATVVGGAVSVKPKRGEGVGAIGRGEGIAVWAVALLESAEDRTDPA